MTLEESSLEQGVGGAYDHDLEHKTVFKLGQCAFDFETKSKGRE